MTYSTLGKAIEIIIKSTFGMGYVYLFPRPGILNSKLPCSIFIQFFLVAVKLMGFALKETSSDFALNLQVS